MRSSLIFTAVLLLCVTLCSADPTINDPTVTLTFLTANPPGNTYNGNYYAYPYTLQVGTGPGASAVPMMCDDFTDDISSGDSWLSTAYALTQTNLASDVTDFRYGNQTTFGPGNFVYDTPNNAVTAYEEAAYILTQVALGNFSPSEGNAAVWYLFSDTGSIAGDTTARGLLDTAYTFVTNPNNSNYDYSNVTVYTQGIILSGPHTGSESQEFLGFAAPEPPASLLLVIGFALIGAVGLKRRKQVAGQVVKPRSDC